MSQIAINTSQNVNINFNVASVGERMLAFIIDLLIKIAYWFDKLLMMFWRYAVASLFIPFSSKVSKRRSSITVFPLMMTVLTSFAFVE